MKELKHKTIYGLAWNFIERFFNYFFQFVVGIILARLLSPKEFGLMGMLAIFISLSQIIVFSGLNDALIRKRKFDPKDYASLFVFNISISLLIFVFLWFLATPISKFYQQDMLKYVLIILSLGLIFEAAGNVIFVKLQHEMNFKLPMQVTLIASFISGIIAIFMAVNAYGIWALVALHVSRTFISSLLIWILVPWKPKWVFDFSKFKDLFAFGKKILLGGIVDVLYSKGFYLLIGKLYSPAALGFFNRADRFQELVSFNISGWIAKVSYPVLSKIEDIVQLKNAFKKMLIHVMFITFFVMFGLGAIAESLIITLLGEAWAPSIPYLQILVFVGMTLPLQSMNTDVLKVLGRSDLFLRVIIIKKLIAIPLMIITAFISIKVMILGMLFMAILSYGINVYWSYKFIHYGFWEQLRDIFPIFITSMFMGILVFLLGYLTPWSPVITLLTQLIAGTSYVILYGYLTKNVIFHEIITNIRAFLQSN